MKTHKSQNKKIKRNLKAIKNSLNPHCPNSKLNPIRIG